MHVHTAHALIFEMCTDSQSERLRSHHQLLVILCLHFPGKCITKPKENETGSLRMGVDLRKAFDPKKNRHSLNSSRKELSEINST